ELDDDRLRRTIVADDRHRHRPSCDRGIEHRSRAQGAESLDDGRPGGEPLHALGVRAVEREVAVAVGRGDSRIRRIDDDLAGEIAEPRDDGLDRLRRHGEDHDLGGRGRGRGLLRSSAPAGLGDQRADGRAVRRAGAVDDPMPLLREPPPERAADVARAYDRNRFRPCGRRRDEAGGEEQHARPRRGGDYLPHRFPREPFGRILLDGTRPRRACKPHGCTDTALTHPLPRRAPITQAEDTRAREAMDILTAKAILHRNYLFRGLPEVSLERVASLASRRTYDKGAVIFAQGDEGDALYGVAG